MGKSLGCTIDGQEIVVLLNFLTTLLIALLLIVCALIKVICEMCLLAPLLKRYIQKGNDCST